MTGFPDCKAIPYRMMRLAEPDAPNVVLLRNEIPLWMRQRGMITL